MNKSKILTIAVVFTLMASFMMPLFGVGPVADAAAEDPVEIKIGFLNPITGDISQYAPAFTQASELAIDHLNEGHTDFQFTVVEADSGCNANTAAEGANSLVSAGVIGVAGAACSGASMSAQPIISDAGIPMVSYASTSPAISMLQDGDYFFRVVPSDAQQGIAMAYMAAAHGWQNPGVIYMTNDYGAGLYGSFKGAYEAGGGSLCVEIGYTQGETDFATVVSDFAAAECDSLVAVTYATDGAALLEEMAAQEIEGPASPVCDSGCPFPTMGGDGIATAAFLGAFTDPSAAAMVIATKPAAGEDSAAAAAFEEAWTAAYVDDEGNPGNSSLAIYIHQTYDAITMLGKAAVAANCDNQSCGAEVRDQLRLVGVNYDGASGVHTFDGAGDVGGTGYDVCQFVPVVVDGQPSLDFRCNGHFGTTLSFPGSAHIKIGMLNPITGDIAQYSPGFSLAAGVAEMYMNTIQPLNYRFEVIEADSGCNANVAAEGAQFLVNEGVVGIAGAACSSATMSAITVAQEAKVPMVSYASTSPAITGLDDDGYLWRVVPSDAQQGQALAAVVEASGSESPALLYMSNDYGAGFAEAFKDNFDGEICVEASHDQANTDFQGTVSEVVTNGCDSVVMITYATDGAYIAEELNAQDWDGQIFGGDGIADENFEDALTDASAIDGVTVTRPAAAADSPLGAMFDMYFNQAACNPMFDDPTTDDVIECYAGGIYTRETFDAIAIIGLAQAIALTTPIETDGVKEMLGLTVGAPGDPQPGASGLHSFDANGDVAGSGYEVCTFWMHDDHADLDCHSSWDLITGLDDQGIPQNEGDDCPLVSEAGQALCEQQADDDGPCDGDTAEEGTACGEVVKDFCANNDDEGCATVENDCASSDDDDAWEKAFCAELTAEEEVVEEEVVEEEVVEEEETTEEEVVEEAADEVPGFGLISAVAAIGAVLLLRRRL